MNPRHLTTEQLRGLRWRGYVRESTQEQTEKWSPIRQRRDLERAAAELGLVGDPFFYERTGSGETDSLELVEALADARRGEYDVLLVLHTTRFARNRAEAVRVKAIAARYGPIIYFVEQRIISGPAVQDCTRASPRSLTSTPTRSGVTGSPAASESATRRASGWATSRSATACTWHRTPTAA